MPSATSSCSARPIPRSPTGCPHRRPRRARPTHEVEMRPGGPSVEAVTVLARTIFPPTQSLVVERLAEGVATYVYRIGRGDERFYLRILPEIGDSFAPELAAIRATIARHDAWLDAGHGHLAHGDLDATHIFQHEGGYAGIIDFGEIRGTDPWYDLGHFAMRDGEILPAPLLPWLLEGYGSVAPLPDDHPQRIAFASL